MSWEAQGGNLKAENKKRNHTVVPGEEVSMQSMNLSDVMLSGSEASQIFVTKPRFFAFGSE
jgi:hypothetical protein